MKDTISLIMIQPSDQVIFAINLIEKFKKKNKLKFSLNVCFDFTLGSDTGLCGVYYPDTDNIILNPSHCGTIEEMTNEDDTSSRSLFFHGYTRDISEFGVLCHEFSHFLQFRVFKTIIQDYQNAFPTERLYLNDYSNTALDEEQAEQLTLYLTNPYLLKLISKPHYDFYKEFFKSPVTSSEKQFKTIYDSFPIKIKNDCKKRWKINFDYNLNKFVKLT